MSRLGTAVATTALSTGSPSRMTPAVVARSRPETPRPPDAFAWGSTSTSSTRAPASARQAARLTAVVVLPTPPFWFATA